MRVARRALEIDAAQVARRSLSRVLRTANILKIEKRKTKNDGGVLGKHLLRLAEEKCENQRSRQPADLSGAFNSRASRRPRALGRLLGPTK